MQNIACLHKTFFDKYSRNLQMDVHKVNIVLPTTWNYNINPFMREKIYELIHLANQSDKYKMPMYHISFVINFHQA